MKYLLVAFAMLCLGCNCFAKFNSEQAKILGDLAKTCFPELGIPADSDMMERAVRNELTYTELETARKYNVLDAEDKFITHKIKDFLLKSNAFPRQDIIDVIDKCYGEREEATVDERAREAFKCFMENKKFNIV